MFSVTGLGMDLFKRINDALILNQIKIKFGKLTIDLEESCEVRGSGGIFGHTGVSTHVLSSGCLDCQRAYFSANFTDDEIRAAGNL